MSICPDDQHQWGPWVSAPIPCFVHVGNGILDHPVLRSGIPIDWRPEAQRWSVTCTRCGKRMEARPTVPRSDAPAPEPQDEAREQRRRDEREERDMDGGLYQ